MQAPKIQSRRIVINLSALAQNFFTIKNRVGNSKIMSIVKANAYGHGLVECAKLLQNCGTDYVGVAIIEEAIQLRKNGIIKPILVLGGIYQEQLPLFFQHDIEIMASSIEKLDLINNYAKKYKTIAKVHLKIDTGLGRIGVRYENAENFILHALKLKHIDIIGITSHFATSDEEDKSYTHLQCERFKQACATFEKYSIKMPLRHIANSGAIIQHPESYFDMVRPGIMLYGIYPSSWMNKLITLEPVMSVYAKIVYFKVILIGSGVSYALTWCTKRNTRIITVPIGYGDGYPRALSNKGEVLFDGKRFPIVGNICMDQMMIDIGGASAFNGQEVVLIGRSGDQEITVNQIADLYGGSPYEFLVLINNRIEREYVQNNNALHAINQKESLVDI